MEGVASGVRVGGVPELVVCVEVSEDDGVVVVGEEIGQGWLVVWLAG